MNRILFVLYAISITISVFFPYIYLANNIAIITILLGLLCCLFNGFTISYIKKILLYTVIVGVIEAIIGLFTYNNFFVIGTQENQTMFSMCVSLSMVALLYLLYDRNKIIKIFVFIIYAISFLAIILSGSRTGVLCMCILFCLLMNKILYIKRKYTLFMLIVVGVLFIGLHGLKNKSSEGRLFILSNTYKMIQVQPFGWGYKGFAKNYMMFQADFFKENFDEKYVYLADNIRHPLNEFVHIAVDWGVWALLVVIMLIAIILFLIYKFRWNNIDGKVIILFVILLFIWALFAYPSLQPFVWLLSSLYFFILCDNTIMRMPRCIKALCVSFIICASVYIIIESWYRYNWEKGVYYCTMGMRSESLNKMENVRNFYVNNDEFLYSYASVLYHFSMYEETISVLKLHNKVRASYDAELLLANSYMLNKEYNEAEKYYKNAFYMCPVRLIPLYNLFKIYKERKEINKMKIIGNFILSRNIKIKSEVTDIIKHNVSVELSNL